MAPTPANIPTPPGLRWLIELVGEDATLRLVEVHGGTRMFVPKKLNSRSELVRNTKLEAKTLEPLAKSHGGELLKLPLCREWRVRIYRERDRQTYSEIARRLGVVENTVWRILNDSGMTAQMDLPL